MTGDGRAYRVLVAGVGLVGLVAVAFGIAGLYAVLTGGPADEPAGADVLGDLSCESFDGDPDIAHEADYDVERTLVDGSELAAVEASTNGSTVRMEVTVEGELLNASARTADGRVLAVERLEDDDRVVIAAPDGEPFRLWVDSLAADATVTRTRLEVCP